MKILVPLKRVADPDNANKVKIPADGSKVDSSGLEWKPNPFDEYAVEAALRALVRAEQFAMEHPEEAKKSVVQQLEMEPEALDEIWGQIDLRVSLGQELLTSMEDENSRLESSGSVLCIFC